MTDRELNLLRELLETLERDEGACYKDRSHCTPACPLWMAGEFGGNICLPSILARRVKRLTFGKALPTTKGEYAMKAIRKKPGCAPEIIEVENTLKALQAEVGGYIEAVTLPYGAALICNEEGRILGLPDNGRVCGVDAVGTVLIVGTKGEEFCDVPAFFKRTVQHG